MPLAQDINLIPEFVPVRLPDGDWDDDEIIALRPYYDGFVQVGALSVARREIPDGTYADNKPKVRYELDMTEYQRYTVFSHMVLAQCTIRNPPTPAQVEKGERGSIVKFTLENFSAALGETNVSHLLKLVNEMSGEPPGGYQIMGPKGREMTFRSAGEPAPARDKEPVHSSKRATAVERRPDSLENGLDVSATPCHPRGMAQQDVRDMVAGGGAHPA